MATLTRPQVVLRALQGEGTGDAMINTSLTLTKTATMTHGTLLLADGTEAADLDITNGDVVYVIDDLLVDELAVGEQDLVRVVEQLDWVIFRPEELRVGSTPLTAPQLTAFGKRYQASTEVVL